MRGLILAGGLGSRLHPLTLPINKHLLHVYSKPMIFYPIETLVNAGITDVAIVVSGKNPGQFIEVLKNGNELGLEKVTYLYQEKPDGGIGDALALAETFADDENLAVILGDNTMDANSAIFKDIQHFSSGAHIFLKKVDNPQEFGVVAFDADSNISEIIEKPPIPPSEFAAIGLYLFDKYVFHYVKECVPSARGQMEITDVLNKYLNADSLTYSKINCFWQDAGTFDNLFLANKYWYEKAHR